MTVTPVSEAEFNEAVDDIGPKRTEMAEGINSCIDKYNNEDFGCWAGTFGDIDKIGDTLSKLVEIWNGFVEELAKLASPGWPFWFIDSADTWLDVKSKLTGQKTYLSDGAAISLPATVSWDSTDATVYSAMPGVNVSAIDGAAGHADSLATHMQDHGMQIIDFWFDIGMLFIDYAQLVGTSVANFISADPTKWLDIVSEIVDTVSNLIDFVQDLATLIMDKWTETIDSMYDLKSAFADLSGSVEGAWPTPANLS